jgi:outer membrane protein OmpA-like peptidoglycan-associated protein
MILACCPGMEFRRTVGDIAMAQSRFSPRPSLRRVLVQALLISALPIGTAYAQTGPQVRVTTDESRIRTFQFAPDDIVMTARQGMVFEVIHTHGDKYRHDANNWYWVLLPRDAWGTQRSGWISGHDVEELPPPPPPVRAEPEVTPVPQPVAEPTRPADVAAAPAAPAISVVEPVVSEVIVNFRFAKSDLTDEAKGRLAGAVAMLNEKVESVTIELAGHADSIGSEPYNDKLGMARAESVRQHLAEQHHIPADKISVASFGENQPAVPNDTPAGRAQNRRVVIKISR